MVQEPTSRKASRQAWSNLLMVMPAFVLLIVLFLFPLFQIGWVSLSDPSPGFYNYQKIFTSSTHAKIFYQTFSMCLTVTMICLILGYVVAYTMDHLESRFTVALMLFFVLLPFWTSILIRAYSWIAILRQDGIINHFLIRFGLIDDPLTLVRSRFGVIGLVE